MEMEKVYKAKPIKAGFRTPVSILVPYHGNYEGVTKLIESIWTLTQTCPYEICLIDDASPNKRFFEDLRKLPQIVGVRSEERLGFGGALALGFKSTAQPYVVFLNSDCMVRQPTWLTAMGQTLVELKSQNVRMVCARSNNPGEGTHEYLKAEVPATGDHFILDKGFLPLYCAMCHRELFEHIGGFIKAYPYGCYEDEELAFRMRHYGFRQAICGTSWIHHEGAVTLEAVCRSDSKAAAEITENRNRCIRDISNLRK